MVQERVQPEGFASWEWRGASGQRRRKRAAEWKQSGQEAPSAEQFVLSVRSLPLEAYVPRMAPRVVGIHSSMSD